MEWDFFWGAFFCFFFVDFLGIGVEQLCKIYINTAISLILLNNEKNNIDK